VTDVSVEYIASSHPLVDSASCSEMSASKLSHKNEEKTSSGAEMTDLILQTFH